MSKIFVLLLLVVLLNSTTATTTQSIATSEIKTKHHETPKKVLHHVKRPKVTVHCVTHCMDKVKSKKVQKCKKIYQKGAILTTCSIKKLKFKCNYLCAPGKAFCFKRCKIITCDGKKVTVCKKHCIKGGSRCKAFCVWKKERICINKRLPGKWLKLCKSILVSKKFKSCMKFCIKKVPKLTCGQKCRNIHVPYKYQKCLNILLKPERKVHHCSVTHCVKSCKNKCKRGKKVCFRKCHVGTCDGKPQTFCKFECTRKPKVCQTKCAFSKQIECYLKRLPAEYMKLCSEVLAFKKVNQCLKRCVYRNVVVPFQIKLGHKHHVKFLPKTN